jgi:amino acid adenylation domain-containing protein
VDLLTSVEVGRLEAWGHGPDRVGPRVHIVDSLAAALADNMSVVLESATKDAGREGQSLTGNDLWRWVNHVAASLQRDGVEPSSRVAVEMHRSADAVVALLAIALCGASYVPIDPDQPAARRSRLIERADCVLTLRSIPGLPTDGGDHPAAVERSLDDEAYLLFTSGSTGEPKGVPISHRGLADYLQFATNSYLAPGEQPVVPLFSALTFDLTVTSLFLPLIAGGRMIVVEGDGPTAVRAVAECREITWCKATPSHVEMLMRLLPEGHRLATLVVGGEAFTASLLKRIRSWPAPMRVFNEYGPTEAVVGCMIYEVPMDEPNDAPDVPIGRPAPGVQLQIVDPNLELVPLGVAGELCISHDGLTSGYIDGDTSAFFDQRGSRWYRSGDLVRLIDDETLVYLRRVDEQLKVGGIRLDPSEIETALTEHPAVRSAAVRSWTPRHREPSQFCMRCGLADNVPGVVFDDAGVCDRCHSYDAVKDQASVWFKTPADLVSLRNEARADRTGKYDCIALLSGGKDSTYTLYQLVELGFEVYALTLDNGYISDEAKANISRTIDDLGIDHEFATTEAMAAIFRDSLDRHSNVCHGCFKTIYTLATARAVELGAPMIVTGLSRGQLFETRLIPAQFSESRFDPDAIDDAVIAARVAYHRQDDAVTRMLDNSVFADDGVFDRIRYVDFYRYVDVELEEMLRYLQQEAPWVRPADTGRSTNCTINAAGIQTHLLEQGFHNYAEPYAWDVRLGHKQRDEALAELDDRDDADEVASMLEEVGYRPRVREVLTAWIDVEPGWAVPTPGELRAHLLQLLPTHAIPAAFVTVDELPTTSNGKLDTDALPAPDRVHRSSPAIVIEPTSPLERAIVDTWERLLGVEPISVEDDFFALGGDSLAALEMTMALRDSLDVEIPDEIVFGSASPRALAAVIVEFLGDEQRDHQRPPQPGDGGDPPVLSAGERAMLFEHALAPDDARYHQGRLYRIEGAVNADRLKQAVARVVKRHQPLHWTFGSPRLPLTTAEAVSFEVDDLAGWADVEERAAAVHRAPFDLEHGPLVRCGLYRIDDGANSEANSTVTGFVIATHHISTDASSFELLWREIEASYHGEQLEPLTLSYADHTSWQASRDSDAARDYWRDAIGSVTPLALQTPVRSEPDGLRERTTEIRAEELSAATGSSPFAAVLAAVGQVLSSYTQAGDVTVGALVTTRDHPSADSLIGYYLNSLPLTISVDATSTLSELRAECGDLLAHSLTHRAYPFAEMVDDRRRAGQTPPVPQVLIALQDLSGLTFGQHRVDQQILYTGSSVADATFFVQTAGDSVTLAVEHNGSVIDGATADRLLLDLEAALIAVLRRPSEQIATSRLPSSEAGVVTGLALTNSSHVLDAILHHGLHRSDRAAVTHRGRVTTWGELDRWSHAIAARLISEGVTPGDRVVVSLPRSAALIAAILGVLRARAAYVPVDPTYPTSRNEAIIAASAARYVVAASAEILTSSDQTFVPVPDVPDPATALPPLPDPHLDDLAYVIFTSGSTGEPKGVPIRHRQLAISTEARRVEYRQVPERFLLVSSAAFDSSVAGLFWTLTAGGALVVPDDQEVHDVDALLDLIADEQVTHTLVVPSLYRGLLARGVDQSAWPSQVVVAGEACPPDIVARHLSERPTSRLSNEYGPTEATVWSTVEHLDTAPGAVVPIGHPIAGTWASVVDGQLRPCPAGVIGELVVGGQTVTEGYDGHDSDRFLTESQLGPGRAFRTGDRAALVDGVLWFHGRVDEQLNVGGIRIEPGEVERALELFHGVEAAVVVAADVRSLDEKVRAAGEDALRSALRTSSTSDDPTTTLAELLSDSGRAVVVAHLQTAGSIDPEELRQHLRSSLPPASIPKIFATHVELPKSPNGKLDRDAAARLDVDTQQASAPARTSHRSNDASLDEFVEIWRVALERSDLGPDDDFFDMGGDSLRALELLFAIEQRYGVRPRVSVLFEARTPRALLGPLGLDGSPNSSGDDRVIVVREGGQAGATPSSHVPPPLWLLPGAGGVPLVFQPLVERLDPTMRILGVEYRGTRGECAPSETVDEIADFVHGCMVTAQPSGPYRLLSYSVGGLVAVEVARRLMNEQHEVELLMAIESGISDGSKGKGMRWRIEEQLEKGDLTAAAGLVARTIRIRSGQWIQRASGSVRTFIEHQALNRYGLRPSDRLVFDRMIAVSTAAGLAHRPAPIDLRIVLYLGADGGDLWVDTLRRLWSDVAGRGLDLHRVSGSHSQGTTLAEPHVAALAELISDELAKLDTKAGAA